MDDLLAFFADNVDTETAKTINCKGFGKENTTLDDLFVFFAEDNDTETAKTVYCKVFEKENTSLEDRLKNS